ncbi:chorion protein S36-like [Teleopsis dalmanni]|uniref:chorion protein S36-like n=1 Tax=Teleopsis dalmanni TaxID=139649 RepID=UPI000D32AEFE|nr:chorion protein S36-like [Teleopsis dalmanni]XP_037937850.1 chorion protein S36-like [Teleopsis dalmanni]XP_037942479.1 chorion protein S36-like [Teleopsis dalmanni]
MKTYYLLALFAVAVPYVAASYGPAPNPGYVSNLPGGASNLDDLVQAATGGSQQSVSSITKPAEVQPTLVEQARLNNAQAQLHALNANPTYKNMRDSDAIAESLATNNLASNIRRGNINLVAPNIVDQGIFRSVLVPSGPNNHNVIATQPLPPIVVNQPGAPPQQVSSGPPAVVKAAPVIYKIKPSVIYQQEIINKVPTPLSLNPVYVKVYKPGKKIDTPVAPVVQPVHNYAAPNYGAASSSASSASDSYANQAQYAPQAPAYAPPTY